MNYKKGIDVSEHNSVIDWDKVKESGMVDFVMIRAGYGRGLLDKRYKENINGCERLGIPYGIYWFSYAKTTDDAVEEARSCLRAIAGHNPQYPIAFDWEDDSLLKAKQVGVKIKGKTIPTQFAVAFLNAIRQANHTPMLYTNKAFLNQFFDVSLLASFDFWFASWFSNPNLDSPPAYGPTKPDIWQYSSVGRIPGISTDVDINVCYTEYALKEETKLTPQEIYDGLMEKLNFEKQSSWAEPEILKAKETGFTDGKNPYNIPSRAEVMTMINRALTKERSGKETDDAILEFCSSLNGLRCAVDELRRSLSER